MRIFTAFLEFLRSGSFSRIPFLSKFSGCGLIHAFGFGRLCLQASRKFDFGFVHFSGTQPLWKLRETAAWLRNVAIANAFGCVPPRLSTRFSLMGGHRTQWLVAFASYFYKYAVCGVPIFSERSHHIRKSGREQSNCARSKPRKPGCCENFGRASMREGCQRSRVNFPHTDPEKSIRRENQ